MEESTGTGGLSRNFARMQLCDELSSCRSNRVIREYIGIMENKMETTTCGLGFRGLRLGVPNISSESFSKCIHSISVGVYIYIYIMRMCGSSIEFVRGYGEFMRV